MHVDVRNRALELGCRQILCFLNTISEEGSDEGSTETLRCDVKEMSTESEAVVRVQNCTAFAHCVQWCTRRLCFLSMPRDLEPRYMEQVCRTFFVVSRLAHGLLHKLIPHLLDNLIQGRCGGKAECTELGILRCVS